MKQHIAMVALLVPDYDQALDFYVGSLGFELIEDTDQGDKRWVVVAPPGGETRLLLARAATERQKLRTGDQTGGRVFLFLQTDDFDRDHSLMKLGGVHFEEEPRDEPYGRVAVFQDPFGNRWDLLQLAGAGESE